jgi:hypothetical protein
MSTDSRRRRMALATLVCIMGALYLGLALTADQDRPVAPLDDAYITFQYARQIALGHPYQYNDGDPPSSGMTSPLYGMVLAACYAVGITGESLSAVAVGMGVAWLGLSAWLSYRLARRLIGRGSTAWARAAAGLVVLTGSLQWGCFNGMETGLFTVLTLGAVEAFVAGRCGRCALLSALAGLTRPEGLVLAVLLCIGLLLDGLILRRPLQGRKLLMLSGAVLAGLVPTTVNWALTGTPASSGLLAKSWSLNVPFYAGEFIRSTLLSYRDVVGTFLGWQPSGLWLVAPGILLLALVGWTGLARGRRWADLWATSSWVWIGALSTATLMTATWHLGRYQVPFVPVVVVLGIAGLAHLGTEAKRTWQRRLPRLILILLLSFSFYSTVRAASLYRRALVTVAGQQLVLADWLRESLPPQARVGVHDTGSLRYVGQRPTYDLIGLTTAEAATAWRHGPGSTYELMEHSPMRPEYFAIYPDVFFIPYLAETSLFDQELFRVEMAEYGVASAGPVQGVWRADWGLADSGADYYQPDVMSRTAGLELVDRLDVADLTDEAAHDLEWWHEVRRSAYPTELRQLSYRVLPEREVLDGGRLLTGGMSFSVATRPGERLWLVARLHAQEAGAVEVEIDGRDVGRWAYPAVPGQWLETLFAVPGGAIAAFETRITLRADNSVPGFEHYAPYYFWFLAGDPSGEPADVGQKVDIHFADAISLVGFDVPVTEWHGGDVVPVTLYWQAALPTLTSAKVFLHLYSSDGRLGPQSDGWAYYATRPPYTWLPGEVVVDPRPLSLPADLPTGTYSLEVGLYEPDTGVRLSAYLDGSRQNEDRVRLGHITLSERTVH